MINYGYMEVLYRAKFAIINNTKEILKDIRLTSDNAKIDGKIKKLKPSKHDGLTLLKSIYKNQNLDEINLNIEFLDSNGNTISLPIVSLKKDTTLSAFNIYIEKDDEFKITVKDINMELI